MDTLGILAVITMFCVISIGKREYDKIVEQLKREMLSASRERQLIFEAKSIIKNSGDRSELMQIVFNTLNGVNMTKQYNTWVERRDDLTDIYILGACGKKEFLTHAELDGTKSKQITKTTNHSSQ